MFWPSQFLKFVLLLALVWNWNLSSEYAMQWAWALYVMALMMIHAVICCVSPNTLLMQQVASSRGLFIYSCLASDCTGHEGLVWVALLYREMSTHWQKIWLSLIQTSRRIHSCWRISAYVVSLGMKESSVTLVMIFLMTLWDQVFSVA